MSERVIMDRAGDLWTVEAHWRGAEPGTTVARCRHELGYELLVSVTGGQRLEDGSLLAALERARRSVPRTGYPEAA